MSRFLWIPLALVFGLCVGVSDAYTAAYGPYKAEYVKNYDGDTVTLIISIWPKSYHIENVRLLGVDTPEISGKCEKEKHMAKNAKVYVEILLKSATSITVIVDGIDGRGRPLVHLLYDGEDLSQTLIDAGLGVVIKEKRYQGWCNDEPPAPVT